MVWVSLPSPSAATWSPSGITGRGQLYDLHEFGFPQLVYEANLVTMDKIVRFILFEDDINPLYTNFSSFTSLVCAFWETGK